ncbi:MAG: hypothetical protein IIW06_07945, partial [Bacteroidaceae bacterium]|nr:hypothetical protein [Bacteroidaceae bacterium]
CGSRLGEYYETSGNVEGMKGALLVLRQDRSALRFNNTKFIAESSLRFTNYIQNTECANHFYTISNYLYTFYI